MNSQGKIGPSQQNARLIITDWGSTNLRSFLVDTSGNVLDKLERPLGIWRVKKSELITVFRDTHAPWLTANPDLLVVTSGMVGSVDGLKSTAYQQCPVALHDLAEMLVEFPDLVESGKAFLVPGIKSQSVSGEIDLIRGEEVQALGAFDLAAGAANCICLPGTHSKWLTIRDGSIEHFTTFVTGEVYEAMANSRMFASLPSGGDHPFDAETFDHAVAHSGLPGGLLHHFFSARARAITGALSPDHLFTFLSGLLIGTELRAVFARLGGQSPVHIIGSRPLVDRYQRALRHFDKNSKVIDSSDATVRGIWNLACDAGLI